MIPCVPSTPLATVTSTRELWILKLDSAHFYFYKSVYSSVKVVIILYVYSCIVLCACAT